MKYFYYLLILLGLIGCSDSPEKNIYKELKSAPLKQLVYQVESFEKDSMYFDTVEVSFKNGTFIWYHHIIQNDGRELELFGKSEIINTTTSKEFWETNLTFEVQSDSVVYFDEFKRELGELKQFDLNGKEYTVVKQTDWYPFSKSKKPNIFHFFTKEYGLILSLSRKDKKKIIGFVEEEQNQELLQLLKLIEFDQEFFNTSKLHTSTTYHQKK